MTLKISEPLIKAILQYTEHQRRRQKILNRGGPTLTKNVKA